MFLVYPWGVRAGRREGWIDQKHWKIENSILFWKILKNYGKFWKIEGFPILLLKTIKKPLIFQLFVDFQGSGRSGCLLSPGPGLGPSPQPHWIRVLIISNFLVKFYSKEHIWSQGLNISNFLIKFYWKGCFWSHTLIISDFFWISLSKLKENQ